MGLLYQFPTDELDTDHIVQSDNIITLRSYGLPPIFWGYLAAGLVVIFSLTLAVWPSVMKIIQSNESIDLLIGYGLLVTVFGSVLTFISFFFYEKNISKQQNKLKISHKLFFIPVWSSEISIDESFKHEVVNYMSSANVAKLHGDESMRGFQNKGYFQLYIYNTDNKKILLDRSSRKVDLEKLVSILKKS